MRCYNRGYKERTVMANVKVILLEPVKNFGNAGTVVTVKRGFFKYLERFKKACYATKEALHHLETEHELWKIKNEEHLQKARIEADRLSGQVLELEKEATENNVLFGSVSARDIANKLEEKGFTVNHKEILLSTPIKEAGTYSIAIELHHDIVANIDVIVKAVKA